ncbi:hypothetical protein PRZ48_000683 [Zasmidium cellare]|uniref:Zn(2)-C6 fungal-type domain-containing protein n=1 Tax=Zasmidium cellare TaxID=395010 RepID=A0ABR0F0I6_ZASCE|nr:hypothetical protein PRZ48_000683 [Zasmidium cellare]
MENSPPASKTPKHHESPSDGPSGSPGRGVKRQKVTRACDNCKSRKRRCTGELPCTACHSTGSNCTYTASYTRGRLVQPVPAAHLRNGSDSLPHADTPVAQTTLAPINNGPESRTSRAASPEGASTFAGQYLGPTSPYTFLRRAWKRFEQDGMRAEIVGGPTEDLTQTDSIWAFGDRQIPPVNHNGLQLPPRPTSSMLLHNYFDLAMPTYRFLHKQTISQWLEEYHQMEESGMDGNGLAPSRQAVVLMVLATARFFNVGGNSKILDPDEQSWRESERFFQLGQAKLDAERGKPRLESVQARIASCLYLLHTSRPNQAWYQFGTTIQLAMALGLHRCSAGTLTQPDPVTRECRKRAFWAASTLDTYLSVILGRPPLIHLDDVDQKFPDPIDDEDLTSAGSTTEGFPRDSIIRASIMHAQITRIVKKAAREQYSVLRKSGSQKLETAAKLNAETAAWHESLPVVLSGAIHPSSLIPIFRRQITVLQLAHCHAQMLINRPSLLLDTSQVAVKESQVDICLSAAKTTLDATLAAGLGQHIFQAFWYTQFVCFNALSIVWVWVIQRKHNRLPALKNIKDDDLIKLANHVQQYLGEATQANAPSLRYSIILEELREEVERASGKVGPRAVPVNTIVEAPSMGSSNCALSADTAAMDRTSDTLVADATDNLIDTMDAFSTDFPLDPDLWLSLDAFPFSDFGQLE